MPWREALKGRLSGDAQMALYAAGEAAEDARELRFRIGSRAEIVLPAGSIYAPPECSRSMMDDLIRALTGASVYAYDRQMAEGYIPLPGGHRAGICGRLVRDDHGDAHMRIVQSVCIRIARQIPGASKPVRRHLIAGGRPLRVLILGRPGSGKTTILRDAALWLSGEMRLHVAAADEREELFPEEECVERGCGVDVMHGDRKAEMLMMMIRSMSPHVIVCDEIGGADDAKALCEAARCGIGLLASAHADSIQSVKRRPALAQLYEAGVFDRYILLDGRGVCAAVYDGSLEHIESWA